MEVKNKLFVARDFNGEVYFYTEKARMREDGTFIGASPVSDKNFLPFLGLGKFTECTLVIEVNPK